VTVQIGFKSDIIVVITIIISLHFAACQDRDTKLPKEVRVRPDLLVNPALHTVHICQLVLSSLGLHVFTFNYKLLIFHFKKSHNIYTAKRVLYLLTMSENAFVGFISPRPLEHFMMHSKTLNWTEVGVVGGKKWEQKGRVSTHLLAFAPHMKC